jgi:hypothetical protein
MISAEYFRAKFEEDARAKGTKENTVRAEVHLISGTIFEIERVLEVEKGHVVLQVYPPETSDAEARRRARGERPADGDASLGRVVLALESIACVHFSPADRNSGRSVGF